MSHKSGLEEVLVEGLVDWIDPRWVLGVSAEAGCLSLPDARSHAFGLIAELLFDGLAVAGDVVGSDHVPWDSAPSESFRRIVSEWISEWGHDAPTPGAIVWLNNTVKGDQIARAALGRT